MCICVSLCIATISGCGAEKTATNDEVQTMEKEQSIAQEQSGTEEQVVEEKETVTQEQKVSNTDAIYIEPIEDISDDFIRGMDASAVLVNENSGVKYYNFEGKEQDVFQTLAEAGVTYIRLRVWNDPYDENGKGYAYKDCHGHYYEYGYRLEK